MYVIRNAALKDMDFIIKLAAKEGWNPGLTDAESFFNADRDGFFIGELSGEPIGCISAVTYGTFGFIGLYIVKEGYRKNGYGIALWNHAMARLAGLNIGLDGVVAQQENYKKSGFHLAHKNFRFGGFISSGKPKETNIVPYGEISFVNLADYDAQYFPVNRKLFLSSWISMPSAYTLVYRKNDIIYGYGTIRRCQTGYKIGPLFAESRETAETLFLSLTEKAANAYVYIDVSETSSGAIELCNKYGMKKEFETARMYTGETPGLNWDNIYGITSFELG
jgi:hypothetical protein